MAAEQEHPRSDSRQDEDADDYQRARTRFTESTHSVDIGKIGRPLDDCYYETGSGTGQAEGSARNAGTEARTLTARSPIIPWSFAL